jgi:AAA-like domain/GUN4-like
MANQYIFSGSLPENANTYVMRDADKKLYAGLTAGKFCYVLNSRQSGKSSLRVQTMRRLREDGVVCAAIDLSASGVQDVTPEQWYVDLIDTIIESFELDLDLEEWWELGKLRSPLMRFRKFIEDVLLVEVQDNIVIFIDEIDSVLSLKFPTDDFFALIRACHNQRVDNPEYNRLTFCLLGVASPSNLIADKKRTPFNIGQAITLRGFLLHEVEPLINGLTSKFPDAQSVMQEILNWTGGQPFLTQKLCQFMVEESNRENPRSVEQVAKARIIENWESQDEPEHLRTIRDRILRNEERAGYLLELYQQIRLSSGVTNNDSMEQSELMLSGLVVKQQDKLQIYSQIYQEVFNQSWIENELQKLRPYSEAFRAWVASGFSDESLLLRGKTLRNAEEWGQDKSLSYQDRQFLAASKEKEIQEEIKAKEIAAELERERKDKEATQQRNQVLSEANQVLSEANSRAKNRIRTGSFILGLTLLLTGVLSIQMVKNAKKVMETQEYLAIVKDLSNLAGELQEQGSDTEAKELFSQAGQAVKIEDHNLKRQVLYSGIAYANIKLSENNLSRNKNEAGKNIQRANEYLEKINQKGNTSPESLQLSILNLRAKGKLDKQKNKIEEAKANYQRAFVIFNHLNIINNKNNDGKEISPAFNPKIKIKLLSKENIEALHREYISLLDNSQQKISQMRLEKLENYFKNPLTADFYNELENLLTKESLKEHYYDELENLLTNRKWKEADGKTSNLMLYIANTERYLGFEDIQKFSCPELKRIDKKWLDASNKRYGFSVQKDIYFGEGNKPIKNERDIYQTYNEKSFQKFMEKVGWYNQDQKGEGNVMEYDQLIWSDDISNSPKGHLPVWAPGGVGTLVFLFSRAATCKL